MCIRDSPCPSVPKEPRGAEQAEGQAQGAEEAIWGLAKEVRARSVLKPLGEELVMLSEDLGVPLFEEGKRKA